MTCKSTSASLDVVQSAAAIAQALEERWSIGGLAAVDRAA